MAVLVREGETAKVGQAVLTLEAEGAEPPSPRLRNPSPAEAGEGPGARDVSAPPAKPRDSRRTDRPCP